MTQFGGGGSPADTELEVIAGPPLGTEDAPGVKIVGPVNAIIEPAQGFSASAQPATDAPAMVTRIAPSGLQSEANSVSFAIATNMRATQDPSPGTSAPGAVVRPLEEDWLIYRTPFGAANAEQQKQIKGTRGRVVEINAWSDRPPPQLYVTLHDVADLGATPLSDANMVWSYPLPGKLGSEPGHLFRDLSNPIPCASGIAIGLSTNPVTFTAPGGTEKVHFFVRYK